MVVGVFLPPHQPLREYINLINHNQSESAVTARFQTIDEFL